MEIISVPVLGHPYEIKIEGGLLAHIGAVLPKSIGRVALVTDGNVAPLYAKTLKQSLEAAGVAVNTVALPAGEEGKSLQTVRMLYDVLLTEGFSRGDCVCALGGGALGDVAGFAAATLFRGMDLIQIPTTLLAQVDSSVGGKTGVNLPEGKNLVGAIYQPLAVFCDPNCLTTLPPRALASGLAEVIKYGMIADEALLTLLENADPQALPWEKILPACLKIKARLVAEDEEDRGVRRILNFGHTIGHAIECAAGYEKNTHGEAVAVGMLKMLELEARCGRDVAALRARLAALLAHFCLPQSLACDRQALLAAVRRDKKMQGDTLSTVQVFTAGKAELVPMKTAEFDRILEEIL